MTACADAIRSTTDGPLPQGTGARQQLIINGYDLWRIERYNVAPSKRVEIIRPTTEGLSVDKAKWEWSPFWAKGEGERPAPINARVETWMTRKLCKQLWPNGRALAPANGWFEWVKDPDAPNKKQPYFISLKEEGGRRKEEGPMFFAALAVMHQGLAGSAGRLCDHHRQFRSRDGGYS